VTEFSATDALSALSHTLAETAARSGGSVVAVNARSRRPASGVHWRAGVVVTAEHLLPREEDILVTLADGAVRPAQLAGRDPGTDLAVLRVAGEAPPVAALGDAAHLQPATLALALARPGQDLQASFGLISAVLGPWRTWRGGQIDRQVRLDLALYPGFSGGALVDAAGRTLGIVTAGLSRSGAIAVPVETVERVVDQLLARGRIARGYLGVGMQPVRLPTAFASTLGLAGEGGVIVVSLEAEGPAARSGVLIGDILVSLDGVAVGDTEDVLALLGPERIGRAVSAEVVRGGKRATITITIGERPGRDGR